MTPPAENAAPPSKTILLVEDDPTVCYFVERVLRNAGYYVGMAADGASGLRLFRVRPWDIVITDRTMPGMNGEELAALIKKEAPEQPIVLITGIPSRVERPELFDAIFGKPFSITDLLAGLSALLQPRREGAPLKT
ncbi:MAG: response regulator [Chthoniobacter sp.]|uniref:response regulator n=1 Tax=Chthoniobacter sp. TaxID=2510640 RepID=UPI0032ACFE6A